MNKGYSFGEAGVCEIVQGTLRHERTLLMLNLILRNVKLMAAMNTCSKSMLPGCRVGVRLDVDVITAVAVMYCVRNCEVLMCGCLVESGRRLEGDLTSAYLERTRLVDACVGKMVSGDKCRYA